MEAMEAIMTRRSIRKFNGEPIADQELIKILDAAMHAPSARNSQSWHFIVEKQRQRLNELSEIHPYGKMLRSAGAAILVCGDLDLDPSLVYQIQNCSAATQNALLAAHALGIGSVWLGIQPREERISSMVRFFKLPPNIVPVSLVALGWPLEKPVAHDRFKMDRIRYGSW